MEKMKKIKKRGKLIDIESISKKTHFSPFIVEKVLSELSKQGKIEVVK